MHGNLLMWAVMAVFPLSCSLPPPGAGDASMGRSSGSAATPVHRPQKCEGYVALSIDDGPTKTSDLFVQLLVEYKIPATFFNTGENTQKLPGVVALERTTPGVQFGNHTWSHPDLSRLSPEEVRSQILETKTAQGSEVMFFRPPFGASSDMVDQEVKKAGLLEVLWTRDSKDFAATSPEQIVTKSRGMTDGGILLLHDRPLTARALPGIIASYYDQNLCFGAIAHSSVAQSPEESPALLFNAKAVAP